MEALSQLSYSPVAERQCNADMHSGQTWTAT